MNKQKFITASLTESSETKLNTIKECTEDIIAVSGIIINSFRNGGKLLLCGNGGSAADCQHIAAELVIRLSHKIKRPALPAIALSDNTSFLTAGGNDIGFENIFERSVEGLGNKGDVLLAISTSGNSVNVIKAVEKAKLKQMKVVAFLGGNGGKIKSIADVSVVIPSSNVQRIQEGHITVAHIICEIIEEELFGGE